MQKRNTNLGLVTGLAINADRSGNPLDPAKP